MSCKDIVNEFLEQARIRPEDVDLESIESIRAYVNQEIEESIKAYISITYPAHAENKPAD